MREMVSISCDSIIENDRRSPYLELPDPGVFDWGKMKPLNGKTADAITVVVPVYGAIFQTLHCLYSVLSARSRVDTRLIVVDDCSPDPHVFEQLSQLANEYGLFTLWRNDANRGVVYSFNRGLFAADGDVILLNSDTIVSDFWIDRLVGVANSDETIASVSPMTNNATILSYPYPNRENGLVDILSYSQIDSFFAENTCSLKSVEVPVTVGFCMLIKREALQATGGFDEALFGIGYGEECDWCMRATYRGYKHVVATDTYVYHQGAVSFSEKTLKRQALAGQALAIRHPEYWPLVARFCNEDRLFHPRRNVDIKRLKHHLSGYKGAVLHVLHSLGGGTEAYVRDVARMLSDLGFESVFARPDHVGRLVISAFSARDMPNLVFNCADDVGVVKQLFLEIDLCRMHLHNIIGFSPEATSFLRNINIPTILTLHDYVSICPQLWLLDQRITYCGVPPARICNICLRERRPPVPAESISAWRREWHGTLKKADRVVAPSFFVKEAVNKVFPDLAISVVPHYEDRRQASFAPVEPSDSDIREIAVLGNLGAHKGRDRIYSCALDSHIRSLPLLFIVFGSIDLEENQFGGKLRKMGTYERANLGDHLARTKCRIGFLPSIWPETFSFVLSELLAFGLYPVVFNLGAQAERLSAAGTGSILEIGLSAMSINDHLLSIAIPRPAIPEAYGPAERDRMRRKYLIDIYGEGFFDPVVPRDPPKSSNGVAMARAGGLLPK
jgi:GT2 family glycosyltransferase